jgi:NADH-quinone oxidoreductase subunit B
VTGEPIRFTLDWGPRFTLSILNVGLACCAIEFVAASMRRSDLVRVSAPAAGERTATDVLVISGTVTDKLAPAVLRLYESFPTAPYVLSFGACSNSGGPYWDSYSVTKGVDQLVPVDVYVPGCPPRPEALLRALLDLQERSGVVAPGAAHTQAAVVLGGHPGPQDLRRPL